MTYHALLSAPQTPAKLSQKTGIHRRSIIAILQLLIREGLVRKQGDQYHAASLEVLQQRVGEKRKLLDQHLPQLFAEYEESKDTQVVNLLQGREGVKAILADELLKGKPIAVLFGQTPDAFRGDITAFDELRIKQQIPLSILSAGAVREERPLCAQRFLEEFHSPMEIHVYANKVAIFLWERPLVLSIKREEITLFWKRYFEWLWNIAKEQPGYSKGH